MLPSCLWEQGQSSDWPCSHPALGPVGREKKKRGPTERREEGLREERGRKKWERREQCRRKKNTGRREGKRGIRERRKAGKNR